MVTYVRHSVVFLFFFLCHFCLLCIVQPREPGSHTSAVFLRLLNLREDTIHWGSYKKNKDNLLRKSNISHRYKKVARNHLTTEDLCRSSIKHYFPLFCRKDLQLSFSFLDFLPERPPRKSEYLLAANGSYWPGRREAGTSGPSSAVVADFGLGHITPARYWML